MNRKRLRRITDNYLYPVLGIAVVVVGWQGAVTIFDIPRYILPSASDTFVSLAENSTLFYDNALSTTSAILLGFLMSAVAGVATGLFVAWFRPVEKTVYPMIVGAQAVPKIALAPIFVVWFGFGFTPRVLMAFLISFFPVVVGTVSGMRDIDPELIYVSRCMGLSPFQRFRRITFPNGLPHVISGLKVAISLAAVGAVVGEFVGSDSGLGNLMLRAVSLINTPLLFAAIIVLTVITVVLYKVLEVSERMFIPWHTSQRIEHAR